VKLDETLGRSLQQAVFEACQHDALSPEEQIRLNEAIGDALASVAPDLGNLLERPVISKRLRQAFSSIGGKAAIAKDLIAAFPPHRVYVEPFAGGAAVFFRKEKTPQEVLSDMSEDVTFIYKAIQNLSDEDIAALQRRNWVVDRDLFNRLRAEYRAATWQSDLDRLYCLLYLRHAVFGSGDPSKSVDISALGKTLTIPYDLPDIRERLSGVTVVRADARDVIKQLDSPDTLFYLDPPYPVGTGQRKDYAYGAEFTVDDLKELFDILSRIKGKFLLSIPAILQPLVPSQFRVGLINTPVLAGRQRIGSRELVVANYDLPYEQQAVQKDEIEILKADGEKRLATLIVMKPWFVDYEDQWADPETIEAAAHRWLLKGARIFLEHEVDISDKVRAVESYVAPIDMTIAGRQVLQGTWIIVVWVPDDELWQWVKENQVGASVRGLAALEKGSPARDNGRVNVRARV